MTTSVWRVLIVEDDKDSLELLMEALKLYRHDLDIRPVYSGEEGLRMMEQYGPTLIIVDLALPGINGWEVLNSIRDHPSLGEVPVVAITAYGSLEVAAEAHRAGFDAYYDKPINVMTFGESMAELIQH